MSEKNNIFENDLLMRSILERGQEEVPARVWDAVSEGLDKAAGKVVRLRWRRAAVSVAAVAAAVTAVFVFDRTEADTLVPEAVHEGMVAVVETAAVEETVGGELLAYVPERETEGRFFADAQNDREDDQNDREGAQEDWGDIQNDRLEGEGRDLTVAQEDRQEVIVAREDAAEVRESAEAPVKEEEVQARPDEYFPTVWEDETTARQGVKTAIVASGITGASGSQKRSGFAIRRNPTVTVTPTKTGIKEKNTPSQYGLPLSVGAGVKLEFTPRWSLGVGLNYTYLTRTFNGTYTHVGESGSVDNLVTSSIRNSQHYLGIPVNAYYNIIDSRRVNFYAYAGGAVEKCIYDKYLILTGSIVHKEPAKGVQLSANVGIGAEFMLTEHFGLYLDPSLRYYFDCDQPKSIRTEQPLMFGFELGFRFRL